MTAAVKPEIEEQIFAERISLLHTLTPFALSKPGAEATRILFRDQLRIRRSTEKAREAA